MLVRFLTDLGWGLGRGIEIIFLILIFVLIFALAFLLDNPNKTKYIKVVASVLTLIIVGACIALWIDLERELSHLPTKYSVEKSMKVSSFESKNKCSFSSYVDKYQYVQKITENELGKHIDEYYLEGRNRVIYNIRENVKEPVLRVIQKVYKDEKIQKEFPYHDNDETYQLVLPKKCSK